MELESSYDLLGVVRDDGIRTYRAIEKASGQEMQVHLFAKPGSEPDRALFRALRALPVSKRRELLEIGMEGELPYIVTEKLPDTVTARDWLTKLAGVTAKPAGPAFLAGSWKTGTPIPEEVLRASHSSAPPVLPAPKKETELLSPDYTRVMRVPQGLSAAPPPAEPPPGVEPPKVEAAPPRVVTQKPQPVLPPEPPPVAVQPPAEEPDEFARMFGTAQPVAAPAPPPKEPGEFTRMFLATQPPAPPAAVVPPPAAAVSEPGEFTRQFLATHPPQPPQPVFPPQSTSRFLDPGQSAAAPQQPLGGAPGEFTSKFLAPQPLAAAPLPAPPLVPADAPPAVAPVPEPVSSEAATRLFPAVASEPKQPAESSQIMAPPKEGQGEFTRFFQSPMYPTAAGNQKMPSSTPMPTPMQANRPSAQPSEFTQMFGNPNKPGSAPPSPLGSGSASSGSSATGVFSTPKSSSRGSMKASGAASGPGEFTRMMSASAPATLGQPLGAQANAPEPKAKSNVLLYVAGGAVLLAIILVIVFFAMR